MRILAAFLIIILICAVYVLIEMQVQRYRRNKRLKDNDLWK